jgi:hypothetical protein
MNVALKDVPRRAAVADVPQAVGDAGVFGGEAAHAQVGVLGLAVQLGAKAPAVDMQLDHVAADDEGLGALAGGSHISQGDKAEVVSD